MHTSLQCVHVGRLVEVAHVKHAHVLCTTAVAMAEHGAAAAT